MTSRSSRMVFAGTVILGLLCAACSLAGGSEAGSEQEARNNAEVAAIRDQLAEEPGVVEVVDVGWSDYITNVGETHANLRVKPGSDLERFADLATEALWTSRISPMKSISVGIVSDTADGNPGIIRTYIVARDRAELEAKFGLRPVPSK